MHEQPVSGISVQPSRARQSGNQRARLTVPLNPGFDCLIGVLAKIPLRRKAPGKMPDCLKASKRHVLGAAQPGFQVCEFRVIRYRPECHQAAFSFHFLSCSTRAESCIMRLT
jgi:hypothetical protein